MKLKNLMGVQMTFEPLPQVRGFALLHFYRWYKWPVGGSRSFCRRTTRCVVAVLLFSLVWVSATPQPDPAVLTSVDLIEATSGSCRLVLDIQGRLQRVETMHLEGGRYVFDLVGVAWDGPTKRTRPDIPGVQEYRYSQLSRDPLVTRFVVEVGAGWSCRHESVPRGVEVVCGGPPTQSSGVVTTGADIAVVRGIGLTSPIAGLDADALIDRSLGFIPEDMVRDGLPNFGATRDDWIGKPRPHKGIDIYGDHVIVQAAAGGRVVGSGIGELAGGWVKIHHGNGVETVYVHISGLRVKTGGNVEKGQPIAVIDGPSGNAVQAQLHFELKIDGQSVDFVPFIYELASDDLKRRITLANERLAVLGQERAFRVQKELN